MKHWRLQDDAATDQASGRYVYRVGWKLGIALVIALAMWAIIYLLVRAVFG